MVLQSTKRGGLDAAMWERHGSTTSSLHCPPLALLGLLLLWHAGAAATNDDLVQSLKRGGVIQRCVQ